MKEVYVNVKPRINLLTLNYYLYRITEGPSVGDTTNLPIVFLKPSKRTFFEIQIG
jgi:hypothetical protein